MGRNGGNPLTATSELGGREHLRQLDAEGAEDLPPAAELGGEEKLASDPVVGHGGPRSVERRGKEHAGGAASAPGPEEVGRDRHREPA